MRLVKIFATMIIYLSAAISVRSNSTSEWTWLNPKPFGFSIHDAWGTGPDNIYFIGNSSIVWHFDGQKYEEMETPFERYTILDGIWGISEDNIMAVGYPATAIQWDGQEWKTRLSLDWYMSLNDVWGADNGEYFVACDRNWVWHYNGIDEWDYQLLGSDYRIDFNTIWGTSSDDVYVSGYAELLYVPDTVFHWDGTEWSPMPPDTQGWAIEIMWGFDSDDIWLAGEEGELYYWNGINWNFINYIDELGYAITLKGAWGTSSQNMYFAGAGGRIIHYDGSQWSDYLTGDGSTDKGLTNLWGFADDDIYAVGTYGLLHHKDETGWSNLQTGPMDHLNGIWCDPNNRLFTVGDSGVVLTQSGDEWIKMASGTSANLNHIWGYNTTAYVVGDAGTILYWDGVSWNHMESGTTQDLYCVRGLNDGTLYVAGKTATALIFDGEQWTHLPESGYEMDLYGVWAASKESVFFTGDRYNYEFGTILFWNGNEWILMENDSTWALRDVFGFGSNDVFTVGGDSQILHYNGTEWSMFVDKELLSGDLMRLGGSNSEFLCAVGMNGYIYEFNGTDWKFSRTGASADFKDICIDKDGCLYIVGSFGAILRSRVNTKICPKTRVKLEMPSEQFSSGDECYCRASVCIASHESLTGYPLFVILDVYGNYYFGPSFSEAIDSYLGEYPSFPPGETEVEIIQPFTWPTSVGNASGIRFISAITDPAVTQIIGDYSVFTFGWSE